MNDLIELFVFLFGGSLLVLLLLCMTLVVSIWLLRRPSRTAGATERKETEMIQEMYHSFGEMERRIETLETILYETDAGIPGAAAKGKDGPE